MVRRHRLEILLAIGIVLVAATFARWSAIPSFSDRHVQVSEEKYEYEVGQPGRWFSAWSLGDGQAYALIAVDPSGRKLAEEIPEAGYRFARAGYGWATWAVSLGRAHFVPYALAIVGALCLVGCLIAAVRLRPLLGERVWLIVLNPALYIGFAGDTSEPMGILVLILALGGGFLGAAGLLGLTRPTYAVALWGNWRPLVAAVLSVAALGVYGLVVFGAQAMVPGGGRLGTPFVAYWQHLSVWGVLLAVVAIGTTVVGARGRVRHLLRIRCPTEPNQRLAGRRVLAGHVGLRSRLVANGFWQSEGSAAQIDCRCSLKSLWKAIEQCSTCAGPLLAGSRGSKANTPWSWEAPASSDPTSAPGSSIQALRSHVSTI